MGNRTSCFNEDDLIDDNPLNTKERESIKKKFDILCPLKAGVEDIKKNFLEEFGSDEVPYFGESIFDTCRDMSVSNSRPSFLSFQKFALDVTRSTPSLIIRKIMSLVCKSGDSNSAVFAFLSLLLECSLCERQNIAAAVDRMIEHMRHVSSSSKSAKVYGSVATSDSDITNELENEISMFIDWVNEYAPHTAKVFVTYFNRKLFPDIEMLGGYKPFVPPLIEPEESSDIISSTADLIPFALYDLKMQGRWKRLYTTQRDGLSFNRIAHHILGYDGPNIILRKVAGSGIVLGAYNEDSWKESNRFYGSAVSFLFTLVPYINFFRSKSNSNNSYQWLNLKSYGMPHGLGLGGDLEKFRLYLPDTLEGCVAHSNCLTFERGSFFHDYRESVKSNGTDTASNVRGPDFEIDVMEVWGCGGEVCLEQALQAQAKDRGDRNALIQKARQVDKAQFANNSFDQEFLLGKTFAHKVRMADDACHHKDDGKVGKNGLSSNNVV